MWFQGAVFPQQAVANKIIIFDPIKNVNQLSVPGQSCKLMIIGVHCNFWSPVLGSMDTSLSFLAVD